MMPRPKIILDRNAAIQIIKVLTHDDNYRRKELKEIFDQINYDLYNMDEKEQDYVLNMLSDSAIEAFLNNTEY